MVARFDVGDVVRGDCDGKRHLHLAALERSRDLESDPLEDADHCRVVGHHLADESFDSARACKRGESFQHPRRDPSPLIVVGDGEGDFRAPRIAQPHVVRERHDAVLAVLGHRGEERSALDPIGLEHRLDEVRVHPRSPVESEVQAARGQSLEEADEPVAIGLARLAQAKGAPVAEDDVDRLVPGHDHRRDSSPGQCARESVVARRTVRIIRRARRRSRRRVATAGGTRTSTRLRP